MFAGQAAIDKVERTKLPCNRISVQKVGKMKKVMGDDLKGIPERIYLGDFLGKYGRSINRSMKRNTRFFIIEIIDEIIDFLCCWISEVVW